MELRIDHPWGLLAAINFCGARVPVQYEVDLWWKEAKGLSAT